jgi:hypothetical protein
MVMWQIIGGKKIFNRPVKNEKIFEENEKKNTKKNY